MNLDRKTKTTNSIPILGCTCDDVFDTKSTRTGIGIQIPWNQPSHCSARRVLPPTEWRMLIFSVEYFCCSHSKPFTSSFPDTDFPCFLRVCCSLMEAHSFSIAFLCFDVKWLTLSNACFTVMSITVWHLKARNNLIN